LTGALSQRLAAHPTVAKLPRPSWRSGARSAGRCWWRGVETEHQRVLLRLAGCDEMQGFLFARPALAKAIDKLLVQAKQGGRPLSGADEALTA